MNLKQAQTWRNVFGKACMLFCLLAFLSIIDGNIAKFREPPDVFHVLPGEVVDVNGPIPENIKGTDALTYISESPSLAVAFEVIHSGYFLGGNMWRGRLVADKDLHPGEYIVTVRPKNYPEDKPGYLLRVTAFPDPLSRQAAFKSQVKRLTGLSPYLVAALFLPFIGITLAAVFLLSRRLAVLQAQQGRVEIYYAKRTEGQEYRIAFGLGSRHGIKDGDEVTILDPKGNPVGIAQVEEASDDDSIALTTVHQVNRPGYLVSRH